MQQTGAAVVSDDATADHNKTHPQVQIDAEIRTVPQPDLLLLLAETESTVWSTPKRAVSRCVPVARTLFSTVVHMRGR